MPALLRPEYVAVWKGLIDAYGARLGKEWPITPVSLCEGNTPLVPLPRLTEKLLPGVSLYAKIEGANPTGSFKDRGMTTAITDALAAGSRSVVCASTGNTAASAAAYAARAGMKCFVLIPDGKVALGKLAGALAFGAQVIAVRGSFDDALNMVRASADIDGLAVVNSVNPVRLLGQQTGAWEVCSQLGRSPDWMALPVGNAGNISAYWMGFKACGVCLCGSKPRMLGVQAAGAAPLLLGHPVANPETKATAIRIGNPARAEQAKEAVRESNGALEMVTDEEIFAMYRLLSTLEGVFCEPSSATGLAGLVKRYQADPSPFVDQTIVGILTGNGLKDPDSVMEKQPELRVVDAEMDALRKVMA